MLKKYTVLASLCLAIGSMGFVMPERGCQGGGVNPRDCIPIGDFVIDCMNPDMGCPVCFTMDMQTGSIKMCYEDGSCMVSDMQSGTTTFYTPTGSVCYTATVDQTTGDLTIVVDGKEYIIHQDGTWTCPDGSTWEMPEECEDPEIPGGEEPGSDECPDIMTLPPCD